MTPTKQKRPSARAKPRRDAHPSDSLPVLFARVDPEIFAKAHQLAADARQSYTQWICGVIEAMPQARDRSRSALAALNGQRRAVAK